MEGKVAYEVIMQVWWERNSFNARPTATDLILLTPGMVPVGTRDCYTCRQNDHMTFVSPTNPKSAQSCRKFLLKNGAGAHTVVLKPGPPRQETN